MEKYGAYNGDIRFCGFYKTQRIIFVIKFIGDKNGATDKKMVKYNSFYALFKLKLKFKHKHDPEKIWKFKNQFKFSCISMLNRAEVRCNKLERQM